MIYISERLFSFPAVEFPVSAPAGTSTLRKGRSGASFSPQDGFAHVITDNDGLDDALGQTLFLELGRLQPRRHPRWDRR